jgi:diaminobutyrate-2-oxoglutarate transaminase
LSKSLSGFGLPLSLTLIRRDLDCWKPGEHNGTFRGNNHAFVTATAALDVFWRSDTFADSVREKGEWLGRELAELARRRGGDRLGTRGVGMMRGLVCPDGDLAKAVTRAAFRDGLILETSGPHGEVVKCMPALTTPPELLDQAMRILDDAVSVALVERDSQ